MSSQNGNGEKRGVSFEGEVELSEAMAYLKSLQAALKQGTVYVQNGNDVVALEPEATVNMEVEARTKKDKQSIKISFNWVRVEEPVETLATTFAISSTEPEIEEEMEELVE